MFELISLKDVVEIVPEDLLPGSSILTVSGTTSHPPNPTSSSGSNDGTLVDGETFALIVRHCLSRKYVGKVVSGMGYCVLVASVNRCSQPVVLHNGEGSSWCSVTFDAVLFKPFADEKIRATILSQSIEGMNLTLNFFREIYIPAKALLPGSIFDEAQNSWYLEVEAEETEGNSSQATSNGPPVNRNYYLTGDAVTFSVTTVTVQEDKGQGPTTTCAGNGGSSSNHTPIMHIVGSFDGVGLGPCIWYS